jgi:hypothetical protein
VKTSLEIKVRKVFKINVAVRIGGSPLDGTHAPAWSGWYATRPAGAALTVRLPPALPPCRLSEQGVG